MFLKISSCQYPLVFFWHRIKVVLDDNGPLEFGVIENHIKTDILDLKDRLDISFVRVKQIQDQAARKVVKRLDKDKAY